MTQAWEDETDDLPITESKGKGQLPTSEFGNQP